jgi:crotonobetainyl-CoA:carnitine CoA-transferase CaiB-like acyl-CoA transferase
MEVLDDARWDTAQKRSGLGGKEFAANAALLRPLVANAFRRHTTAEWQLFFDANPEIVAQRVFDYGDVLADPQAIENGYIVEKDIPYAGRRRVVGIPVQLSKTPGLPQPLFCELGQHTEEVMQEMGYDEAAIAALLDETRDALADRYL